MIPTVEHPNERPNFCVLDFGNLTLWFSYQTCIAVRLPERARPGGITRWMTFIRENDWGPTTGKHINWVKESGHYEQVDSAQFARIMDTVHINYTPRPTADDYKEEFIQLVKEPV